MKRRMLPIIGLIFAITLTLFAPNIGTRPVRAAGSVTLTVTTQADEGYTDIASDGKCSLREALELYSTLTTNHKYSYPDGTTADPCGSGTTSPTITLNPLSVTDLTIKFSGVTQVNLNTAKSNGNGEGGTVHIDLYVDSTTHLPIPLTVNGDLGGGVKVKVDGLSATATNILFQVNESTTSGTPLVPTFTVEHTQFQNAWANGAFNIVNGVNSALFFADSFTGNEAPTAGGGAITVGNGVGLSIVNSTFSGNTADQDGGAIENHGQLSLIATVFSGNKAGYKDPATPENNASNGSGGAIYNSGTIGSTDPYNVLGNVLAVNTFDTNIASVKPSSPATAGGGAIFSTGTINIAISVFHANSAPNGSGGAIYLQSNNNGTSSISDAQFDSNNAANAIVSDMQQGSALFFSADVNIVRTSIGANGAAGSAAAVYIKNSANVNIANTSVGLNVNSGSSTLFNNGSGTLALINDTINANTGGIQNSASGTTTVQNTIVSSNSTNCIGSITDSGNNIDDLNTCNFAGLHDTNPQLAPAFAPVGGYPFEFAWSPQQNSPAIDAGNQSACATPLINNVDQRGAAAFPTFSRPKAPNCTIGAIEMGLAVPTVSKAFSPTTIVSGGVSALTITLTNPNGTALTGATFTDTYPATMVNGAAAGTTTCTNGTVTAVSGSATLMLSGAIIPANSNCTVTVQVTATTTGTNTLAVGAVMTTNGGANSLAASAILTVNAALQPPTVSKAFSPTTIVSGGVSALTITLTNPNGTALTGATFTDSYPATMVNGAAAGTTTCTNGTVTAVSGSATLMLSGAIIPANSNCTVTVQVTATATGTNTLAVGDVTTTNGGANSAPASVILMVNAALQPDLTIAKANNVSGATTVGTPWNWKITVTDTGTFATFPTGSTILSDVLPTLNAAYGALTTSTTGAVTGTPLCAIAAGTLTCTASGGPVTIAAGSTFTVNIPTTASVAATYTNLGATDLVDPNNVVAESNEANNAASDNSVVVSAAAQPDLTIVKANNVSGATTVGTPWNWTVTVTDTGALASFATGSTILSDVLPTLNAAYGALTTSTTGAVTGTPLCAIAAGTLICTANNGAVTIAAGSTFTVNIPTTTSVAATYKNVGATDLVDPNNVVAESNEANNAASDNSVVVSAANNPTATSTNTLTPTVTPSATLTPTTTSASTLTATATSSTTSTATPSATLTPTVQIHKADTIGVFRPSTASFYLRSSNTQGYADLTVQYGTWASYPVVGDWTGGGVTTIGVFDRTSGLFQLRNSNTAGAPDETFTLGYPDDLPFAGRWQANATHDGVGVFRPSNGLIYIKNELSTGFADYAMVLGVPGDVGLAGDWDGDGVSSPGIYRPLSQNFYLSNQVINGPVYGDYQLQLGIAGDVPFAGDWIAQGHAGVGVFRPTNGQLYLKNALITGFADVQIVYGVPNDIPVAGHWGIANFPAPPINSLIVPNTALPAGATATPTHPSIHLTQPNNYDS